MQNGYQVSRSLGIQEKLRLIDIVKLRGQQDLAAGRRDPKTSSVEIRPFWCKPEFRSRLFQQDQERLFNLSEYIFRKRATQWQKLQSDYS
jgi:hypothetical protein